MTRRIFTVTPRLRAGIYGESTNDEAYQVLPGEDRLVKDVMTDEVVVVAASKTAKQAIAAIRSQNTSIVIVCEENDPLFALTEYDLAIHAVSEERADSVPLDELVKTRRVIRCRDDSILVDAMNAMLDHRARHVPVVDAQGGLVGALSFVDAVGAMTPEAAALWQSKVRQLSAEAPDVP
jgi:CBS domain-containing protein